MKKRIAIEITCGENTCYEKLGLCLWFRVLGTTPRCALFGRLEKLQEDRIELTVRHKDCLAAEELANKPMEEN